jgi:hypothetical protein
LSSHAAKVCLGEQAEETLQKSPSAVQAKRHTPKARHCAGFLIFDFLTNAPSSIKRAVYKACAGSIFFTVVLANLMQSSIIKFRADERSSRTAGMLGKELGSYLKEHANNIVRDANVCSPNTKTMVV